MKRLILASSSPRRIRILNQIGLRFESIPAIRFQEKTEGMRPKELVRFNALGKAREVAAAETKALIVGCDTVIELDGHVIGKPADLTDARETLHRLSGRPHRVHSGLAIINSETGSEWVEVETTVVAFKKLSEEVIEAYLATGEPMDKAGAYGIQGGGGRLVREISGSYTNVVGLPTELLLRILRDQGVVDDAFSAGNVEASGD